MTTKLRWLESASTVYARPYQVIRWPGGENDPELTEINLWCWEQFGTRGEIYKAEGFPHRWYYQNRTFWFRDDFDLAWFKMRWL